MEKLVKLVIEGYRKAFPTPTGDVSGSVRHAGWRYLVLTMLKSAADLDAQFASNKKFVEAMGEDGMKKLGGLKLPVWKRVRTICSFSTRR